MIEEAARTRLLAISEITDEIGSRIYPLRLPQNVTYPAISYQKVSNPGVHSLKGRSGLYSPTIEFNIWCDIHSGGYAKCREIADLVRRAFDGLIDVTVSGVKLYGILITGERDFFEQNVEVFRVQQDFIFWHDSDRAILEP